MSCGSCVDSSSLAKGMMSPYAVANPGLSLDEWIKLSDEDAVLVSISEPHKESKGFMKTSVLYTVRTSSREASHSVTRSYKDFVAFRTVLQKRFPGASVPTLPPSQTLNSKSEQFVTKRMHMLEFFMQAICNNPFFRNDDVYDEFVTSTEAFDRALAEGTRAVDLASSEGFNRWKQALDESEVQDTDRLRAALNRELDMVRVQLKNLRKATQHQIDRVAAMANSSVDLYQAFADFYVLERDTIQFVSGPAQLAPSSESQPAREVTMADVLLDASEKMSQYAAVQKSDIYNSKQLAQVLLDPLRYEVNTVDMWKDHLESIASKIKAMRRAEQLTRQLENEKRTLEEKIERDGDPKGKLARNLTQMTEKTIPEAERMRDEAQEDVMQHERGLMGIELARYRASRTLRMEDILRNLTRLHTRGLDELMKIFDGSGSRVRLGRDPRGHIVLARNDTSGSVLADFDDLSSFGGASGSFAGDSFDGASSIVSRQHAMSHQKRQNKFSLRRLASRRSKMVDDPEALLTSTIGAGNLDRSNQMSTAANLRDGTHLRVREDFTATRRDELDTTAGEILTARRVDDNMWYATNSRGEAGLVPSRVVEVSTTNFAGPIENVLRPDRRSKEIPVSVNLQNGPVAPVPPPGLREKDRARIDATARASVKLPQPPAPPAEEEHHDDDGSSDSESDLAYKRMLERQREEEQEEAERLAELEREREEERVREEQKDDDDDDSKSSRRSRKSSKRDSSKSSRRKSDKHSSRRKSKSVTAMGSSGASGANAGFRPPPAMLAGIQGFNRGALHKVPQEDESGDIGREASQRRSQHSGPVGLSRSPTTPMEELMQKLAFREKIE